MEMRIRFKGNKKVAAEFDGFTVATDQPRPAGGDGSAPSPFELFLASLGTCAGFFALSFCQKRSIPTEGIELLQTAHRDPETHMVTKIALEIRLPKNFPEKYRDGLAAAANLCTVKKHLQNPPRFEIETKPA
ncbi:MAG: OsmC family protein [Elusimicrobia bacterium]|nr:OsmC family protein [Elusimicrobiota bacterium]